MSDPALEYELLLNRLLMQGNDWSTGRPVCWDYIRLTEQVYKLLCAYLLMTLCLHMW